MVNSQKKGDRRERQMINEADTLGYGAMRAPSSGSATTRDMPDVIVGCASHAALQAVGERLSKLYFLEIKSDKNGTPNLSHEEVNALCRVAELWGGEPWVVTHPDYDRWHFFRPNELTVNEKSRGVTRSMYPGRSIEEVLGDETEEDL